MSQGISVFHNSDFVYEITPIAIGLFGNHEGGLADLSAGTIDDALRNFNSLSESRGD